MRYTFRKDKKNRKVFFHNEKLKKFFKTINSDQSIAFQYRFFVSNHLRTKPKALSRGFSKNHCFLSFRCGGVVSSFGLSRIKFREMANAGFLPGIRRSSW